MNYRHAYHAGNHADVLKHVVLTRVIEHLKKKEKPFRVVDAHAGTGLYALDGVEAGKTREWEGGVGKMAAPFSAEVETLLKPWRGLLQPMRYPGSPLVALKLMRPGDRMVVNELHPQDRRLLAANIAHDLRVAVTGLDAEICIKANLPPKERRGLVLIDPPYEEKDESARAVRMLAEGAKRFATGCFVLWYPVKADELAERLCNDVAALEIPGTLKVELLVREAFKEGGLAGSGVIIINPPWGIDKELALLAGALAKRLGLGKWGQSSVRWLLPPK